MKKYKVYGTTVVTVTKEVWANNEYEACEKAFDKLSGLTQFCGNGGCGDKLIGVYEHDESVSADDTIEYNDAEILEDNPDYFECPECGEECEPDKGTGLWYCSNCDIYYDEDGDECCYDVDEEDE